MSLGNMIRVMVMQNRQGKAPRQSPGIDQKGPGLHMIAAKDLVFSHMKLRALFSDLVHNQGVLFRIAPDQGQLPDVMDQTQKIEILRILQA